MADFSDELEACMDLVVDCWLDDQSGYGITRGPDITEFTRAYLLFAFLRGN